MSKVRLGDVCFLKAGKGIKSSQISDNAQEKPYPCYGGNGLRGFTDNYTHEGIFNLIGRQGALCGNVQLVNGKFYATEHAVVVQPIIDMNVRWLYYNLMAMNLNQYSTGAAQPGLNIDILSKLEFDMPSTSVQEKIATVFDKVTDLIALRKQQLSKLDELVKARFVELFGDFIETVNPVDFESICEFVTVGIANSATHAFCDDGVIMFRNQNIKEDYLDASDIVHITSEFASKYKTKMLKKDDLLIVRTGYPGVACLVPEQYEGCQTFTTLIARLKDTDTINPRFVCHYINSEYGKKYVKDNSAGAAQQNFGATALSKLPICIPPIELQNEYISFVEQTDKSKLAIQKSLDELETLKKALMQEYFG